MKQIMIGSVFYKQLQQKAKENNIKIQPLHLLINLLGLVMFPFVASPILKMLGELNQEQFNKMMIERKKLIPIWIDAILKAK